jgi:AcrR family transcriptional regulator
VPDPFARAVELEDAPSTDETTERILGAALAQAEDFGLRRFTMDDVARRTGVSRVTVYRYFPRKDQLLDAILMVELRRFLRRLDRAVRDEPGPVEKVVEGLVFSMTYLRGHRLLQRLLRTEPELLLPHLTLDGGPAIAAAREFVARHTREAIAAGDLALREEDIDGHAELLVRIALSFVIAPQSVIDIDDPDVIRDFTRRYLEPVIAALRP